MLRRETEKQLMRDLVARGAAPDQRRAPSALAIGITLLLASIALYWLTRT